METGRYRKLVNEMSPKPKFAQGVSRAFLAGGFICFIGQFVFDFFRLVQPTQGEAVASTLATMIFLGALFTALGWYDNLGEWAGGGAAVPITGFANTMVAAAMDYRQEGIVLGMASKMFVIAGPVIVFAVMIGLFVGLIRSAVLGLFA